MTCYEAFPSSDVSLSSAHVCCPQGWFSPGQVFVLDEYCARYGVRGCHRHLCYLSDLLERAENGAMIDPTLLHYSFAFCASHVHGNRYNCLVLALLLPPQLHPVCGCYNYKNIFLFGKTLSMKIITEWWQVSHHIWEHIWWNMWPSNPHLIQI